eukprot:732421-Prymnesium_polylepis.3
MQKRAATRKTKSRPPRVYSCRNSCGHAHGEHVQSMGHARCRRGSEVLRYVQKTSGVPHA